MRNRLIHAYFDVDMDIVWSTVTKDLPLLKAELERLSLTEQKSGTSTRSAVPSFK
jgi:uncharacterized protein with HEPN domain